MFAVGAFSYGVAPLWLAFMTLGIVAGGQAQMQGTQGSHDAPLWLLTLFLLLLPRVLGAAAVIARGEAAAFGGTPKLLAGALLELLMSAAQAPLRMLAHCAYVVGALTGLELEWKSPSRASEVPRWGDVTRRVGSLVVLPLAVGFGLMQRAALLAFAPMLLPLSLAVPYVVLTGHPRLGQLAQRLGLLRTPEEHNRPRPLVRTADSRAFVDLQPVPALAQVLLPLAQPLLPRAQPLLPLAQPLSPRAKTRVRRAPAMRIGSAAVMAATAVLAFALPRSGVAPVLPPEWHLQQHLVAYDDRRIPMFFGGEVAAPRKPAAQRTRPARMIDNALRRRAFEAVERATGPNLPA